MTLFETKADVRAVSIAVAMKYTAEFLRTVTDNYDGISNFEMPNPYYLADSISDYIQTGKKGDMPGKIERRYQ